MEKINRSEIQVGDIDDLETTSDFEVYRKNQSILDYFFVVINYFSNLNSFLFIVTVAFSFLCILLLSFPELYEVKYSLVYGSMYSFFLAFILISSSITLMFANFMRKYPRDYSYLILVNHDEIIKINRSPGEEPLPDEEFYISGRIKRDKLYDVRYSEDKFVIEDWDGGNISFNIKEGLLEFLWKRIYV